MNRSISSSGVCCSVVWCECWLLLESDRAREELLSETGTGETELDNSSKSPVLFIGCYSFLFHRSSRRLERVTVSNSFVSGVGFVFLHFSRNRNGIGAGS